MATTTQTFVFCRQHNFWNGLYGYQCYCLHMTTEKNYQKYKVVVKCEWTCSQTCLTLQKITRVCWTYLGVVFEQLNTEAGATKKKVNVTRMKVIFKITKRHQIYVEYVFIFHSDKTYFLRLPVGSSGFLSLVLDHFSGGSKEVFNFKRLFKNLKNKECIPVGCVPPAAVAPGTPLGAGTPQTRHPLRPDTPTPPPGSGPPRDQATPLWTEWLTGVKILPCPKLHLRAVNM